jgi:hypothetical protein
MQDSLISIDDVVEGAVLEILALVGTKERAGTPNSGDVVDLILASVGLPPGQQWCAATVFYAFMKAAAKLYTVNPCPRTGHCLTMWDRALPHHRTQYARRGAIFIMDHDGDGPERKGHAGIVTADDNTGGVLEQVSGNTNAAGSRSGDRVAKHFGHPALSHKGKLVGYIDFRLPAPAAAA